MVRSLRLGVMVLAVSAICALVTMWVRSYKVCDALIHGPIGKDSFIQVTSNQGRVILLMLYEQWSGSARSWETHSFPVNEALPFPLGSTRKYESFMGFGTIRGPILYRAASTLNPNFAMAVLRHSYTKHDVPPCSGVILPYWSLVLLMGLLAKAPSCRWPLRFSMRGLLVAMTFASILLGLVAGLDLGAPR